MRKYVAGFLFTEDLKQVVLIRKNKPEWQRGKLNAVGGKIEGDELPTVAQRREFKEEAGKTDDEWEWQIFCKLQLPTSKDSDVIYFSVGKSFFASCTATMTDETVCLVSVESIENGRQCIGYEMPSMESGQHVLVEKELGEPVYNLPWLVRMALDHLLTGNSYNVEEAPRWPRQRLPRPPWRW